MGLIPFVSYNRAYNEDLILQFYATCYFHNRDVTWMTGEDRYTATFTQFVEDIGFRTSGYRIHSANQKDKPKGINDCLRFVASGLETDDRKRKPNDISIWKQPCQFLYQCVLRTMYPKSGDKIHYSSSAITLMCLMQEAPQ